MQLCKYIRRQGKQQMLSQSGYFSRDILKKLEKNYLGILRIYLREIRKNISQINKDDIEIYFQTKIKSDMSISSYKQLTWVLKLFLFRFLERKEIVWNELYPENWEIKSRIFSRKKK